jgi:hypothetical protein
MRIKKTLISVLSLLAFGLNAQTLETGVFAGSSYYLGDINPEMHFSQSRPAFGVVARYNHGNRWAIRANLLFGRVQAKDSISGDKLRGLSFQSNITEFSAVVEFNFLPYETGNDKMKYTPYIFGGIGLFFFNPTDIISGNNLRDYGTEGQKNIKGRNLYSLRGVSIPFGVGFKYSLTEKIGLGVEWGMRKTFTDYIDDVSTTYHLDAETSNDPNLKFSDPTSSHKPGQERGNPNTNDWYNFFGLSVTYKFKVKKEICNNF